MTQPLVPLPNKKEMPRQDVIDLIKDLLSALESKQVKGAWVYDFELTPEQFQQLAQEQPAGGWRLVAINIL